MKKLLLLLMLSAVSLNAELKKVKAVPLKAEEKKAAQKPKAEEKKASEVKVEPAKAEEKKAGKLKVVTTLEVLKALTKEIGKDLVEVESLSSAADDPHFVKAKPTFKRLVSEADLFIEVGRSLELWVPQVIESSGNPKLSGDGLIVASADVKALEVPKELSRKHGDVHPEGNPHIWLSPTAALKIAENIKKALSKKDPAHAKNYEENFTKFKLALAQAFFGKDLAEPSKIDFLWRLHEGKKLDEYLSKHKKTAGGFLKLAKSIDYPFITYHTVWSYMADEFQLNIFAQIEEKSGIAPSLKYQNELIKKAKAAKVRHIVTASYYKGNSKLIDLIKDQIEGQRIFIDVDCQKDESYIAMMDRILNELSKFKELPKIKNG